MDDVITTKDMVREVPIDFFAGLNIPSTLPSQNPQNILLTGVTGFLGKFMMPELLKGTTAKIYCLIRGRDDDDIKGRLEIICRSTGVSPEDNWRIIPVLGDLERDGLGIDPWLYEKLGVEVGSIYHCGAFVNHLYPYEILKAANVNGTLEIIKLAASRSAKAIYFMSTFSVMPQTANEKDSLQHGGELVNGYVQSKWVAENLIQLAGQTGLPVSCFRLGMVGAHSRTGFANFGDVVSRVIRACVRMKAAPRDAGLLPYAPVDILCRDIVFACKQPDVIGKTFHPIGRTPPDWNSIFNLMREAEVPLEFTSIRTWVKRLMNEAPDDLNHPLHPLVEAFPLSDTTLPPWFITIDKRFDSSQFQALMKRSKYPPVEIDLGYVQRVLHFFASNAEISTNT